MTINTTDVKGLRDSALKLALQGYRVFPCNAKKPLTTNGVKDATTDTDTINAWWTKFPNANPATGFFDDSRNIGLDVDVDVEVQFNEYLKKHEVFETRTIKTGKQGSHYVFKRPEGLKIQNISKYAGLFFELKSHNQYLMAPGSVHPETGRTYRVIKDIEPAILPEWLLQLALSKGSGNGHKPPANITQTGAIPDGQRNATLTRIAGAMRRQGATPAAIEAALINTPCQTPLPESEIKAIAASVGRYEPKPEPIKHNWHDYISDHDTLLSLDLPPMEFVIEDLLPSPGLGIIAGKKKIFKSFMGMQMSQCVGAGKPFLGFKTRQGRVLHCALEDGERRLHTRLKMQNAIAGLPINYLHKLTPLNTPEGIKELAEIITELKPVLTIIDTLAAAKDGRLNENEAGDTSDLLNNIRRIALDQNTTILLIAHHGKKGNFPDAVKDPGFDIRGSSAIPGATDTNIGVYKNLDGTFEFIVEGRDISEQELRLSFDREITWCWQNEGNAVDLRRSEADERIISAIDELGGGVDATAIAIQADLTRSPVQKAVKRLRESGQLDGKLVDKKILYSIPSCTLGTSRTDKHQEHYAQEALTCASVHDGHDGFNGICRQCGPTKPVLDKKSGSYKCGECGRFYPKPESE
ncbi:bifunctional DNA primase/polymerase [Chloroflexota bacterium]